MANFIMALLLIATPVLGQDIKVQWATTKLGAFVDVGNGAESWVKAPKKDDPSGKPVRLDDAPGWVSALLIGNSFLVYGCDHYAVAGSNPSKVYCWRDDLALYGVYGAQVCSIVGELVSRCTYYGTFMHIARESDTEKAWSEFHAPPNEFVRHGKMLSPDLWRATENSWDKRWTKLAK